MGDANRNDANRNNDDGALLLDLVEAHPDAMWMLDTGMRLLVSNQLFRRRFYQLFGARLNTGDCPLDHLDAEDRERWEGWYRRALGGRSFAVLERYDTPEGEFYFDVSVVPRRDSQGEPVGIIVVSRDVTEYQQREMTYSQQEGRLQAVLSSAVRMNTSLREPHEVYRETMDLLVSTIPATTATVQLLRGTTLEVVQTHGFPEDSGALSLKFPLTEHFPNHLVVSQRRTVSLADIRREYPHFLTEDGQYHSGHVRSWMGVPLIDEGEVVGMFTIDRDTVDPFTREEIELATALAHHAAVAIRNARSYHQQGMLLRELMHRVQNTTQLILSFINLRYGDARQDVRDALDELAFRIRTLAAVQESMYPSGRLDQVDVGGCIRRVVRELELRFGAPARGAGGSGGGAAGSSASGAGQWAFSTDIRGTVLCSLELAVPLGLLANELIYSAIRFGDAGGSLAVQLDGGEERLELAITVERTAGDRYQPPADLHKELCQGLAAQIHGELEVETDGTHGVPVVYRLRMPTGCT